MAVVEAAGVVSMVELPVERLEAEITGLSAHLSAATCRWLELIGEFDRREGWAGPEVRSCAHWLNWQCGVDLRTACVDRHVIPQGVRHGIPHLGLVGEATWRGWGRAG